jgi:hypothetical protein
MCKYVIITDNDLYICEYTNQICTLCVLGNGNTYKEAQSQDQKESEDTE